MLTEGLNEAFTSPSFSQKAYILGQDEKGLGTLKRKEKSVIGKPVLTAKIYGEEPWSGAEQGLPTA